MGKKKRVRGRHANSKQPDGWRLWLRRSRYNLNPIGDVWHAVIAVFADIGLLFMLVIVIYEFHLFPIVRKTGEDSIHAVWMIVVLGTVCLFLCCVPMCGVRWDKDYSSATILPYLPHVAYIFLILNAFIDYFQPKYLITKKNHPDLGTPYMCLMVFLLIEATALLFYAHDIVCNWEVDPSSRWWVRTTPYACMGMIFVSVLHWFKDTSVYSTFYSVAVSVLAVNYLMQIINDRIVPKEGPYKELHHKADADRSEGGGAAAC